MRPIKMIGIAIVSSLAACAQQQPLIWYKSGATHADYDQVVARCTYETTAATQGTNYSYRKMIGQELDRAMRQSELANLCMRASGYSTTP